MLCWQRQRGIGIRLKVKQIHIDQSLRKSWEGAAKANACIKKIMNKMRDERKTAKRMEKTRTINGIVPHKTSGISLMTAMQQSQLVNLPALHPHAEIKEHHNLSWPLILSASITECSAAILVKKSAASEEKIDASFKCMQAPPAIHRGTEHLGTAISNKYVVGPTADVNDADPERATRPFKPQSYKTNAGMECMHATQQSYDASNDHEMVQDQLLVPSMNAAIIRTGSSLSF